jgi:hypothetical protein
MAFFSEEPKGPKVVLETGRYRWVREGSKLYIESRTRDRMGTEQWSGVDSFQLDPKSRGRSFMDGVQPDIVAELLAKLGVTL